MVNILIPELITRHLELEGVLRGLNQVTSGQDVVFRAMLARGLAPNLVH